MRKAAVEAPLEADEAGRRKGAMQDPRRVALHRETHRTTHTVQHTQTQRTLQMAWMSQICMRGLVGDSSMTSRVLPGWIAARTALATQERSGWELVGWPWLAGKAQARCPLRSPPAAVHHTLCTPPSTHEPQPRQAARQAAQRSLQVTCVHVADGNTGIGHHPGQQPAGAAVQVITRHDVVPALQEPRDCCQRSHARGEGKRALGSLWRCRREGVAVDKLCRPTGEENRGEGRPTPCSPFNGLTPAAHQPNHRFIFKAPPQRTSICASIFSSTVRVGLPERL